MRSLVLVFIALVMFAPPAEAQSPDNMMHPWDRQFRPQQVVGRWQVTGWNPGSTRGRFNYQGVVVVSRTGRTFRVVWRIGKRRFVGIGILRGPIFSVAYNGGLATYIVRSEGLDGVWSRRNGTRLGREGWTR